MTIIEPHEVHKARKLWDVLGFGVSFCFSIRNSEDQSMYFLHVSLCCTVGHSCVETLARYLERRDRQENCAWS